MVAPAPSSVLGEYRLIERIGEGGMATVFRARRLDGGPDLAVKVLDNIAALPPAARERFAREIATLSTLSHPGVVRILGFGEHTGMPYYAMPFFAAGSLAARLSRNGRLDRETLARVSEDLLAALLYLHRQAILHRDIKPANILLDDAGHAVLSDFGMVKPDKGSTLTRSGVVLGTPRYIAPETLAGLDPDATSDLYQVGLVLYEAATGQPPYTDEAVARMLESAPAPIVAPLPARLAPHLGDPLSNLLLNAVEWRREKRYPSATEMQDDLRRALAGRPVERRRSAGTSLDSTRSLAAVPPPPPAASPRLRPAELLLLLALTIASLLYLALRS